MDPKSRHFFFISPSKLFLPRTYTAAEGLPRRKMKKIPSFVGPLNAYFIRHGRRRPIQFFLFLFELLKGVVRFSAT
jgi:hypothetical protein